MNAKGLKSLLSVFLKKNEESPSINAKGLKGRLPNILSLYMLVLCWERTESGSTIEELIEGRIIEVLKITTDMYELIFHWKNVSVGSALEKLFETRMVEILIKVSPTDILGWFIDMLEQPSIIPDFLRADFQNKSRELLKAV